ncbi:hypothetical protein SKAU_G00172620 [Synaphobranchus kaupii]|uniref:Uncharacterized protein n=1 Tax=Synaphobranchus kaupii TaxID=118154 RepID=A0A9Q1J107_SYNKA|nr:hypothetical protein SKAU_G00172620 [Synaphobranchus kaupii]
MPLEKKPGCFFTRSRPTHRHLYRNPPTPAQPGRALQGISLSTEPRVTSPRHRTRLRESPLCTPPPGYHELCPPPSAGLLRPVGSH